MNSDFETGARAAIAELPDREGGAALVLATASTPPAMALLSAGDVHWEGDSLRAGVYGSGSVVPRLGGAFTLLVADVDRAYRIEVVDATARAHGPLALIEGRVLSVRPTAEPPWLLEMRFRPASPDDPRLDGFVEYWRGVRAWLRGEAGPPEPPG